MRMLLDDNAAVMTIKGEAEGEPFEGKVAIGEVIRNRMRLRIFSDGTVVGTVGWPLQFSCWNATAPNRMRMFRMDDSASVTDNECAQAWNHSAATNLVDGSTHYANLNVVTPDWAEQMVLVSTIGRHTFYRRKTLAEYSQ